MCLVHIGLNLKDKGGEIRAEGVNLAAVCHTGQRGRGHFQEGFQERLNAEIGQGRAEEHRAELAVLYFINIQLPSCGQQLHIVNQLLMLCLAVQQLGNGRVIEVNFVLGGLVLA